MDLEPVVAGHDRAWWRSWLRLALPALCPGCGARDEIVCRPCRDRVLRGPLRTRPLADGTLAVASAPWRGPARGLVVAAKESGRRDVTGVLAAALARAVVAVGFGQTRASTRLLLVPPPSTVRAVARRGARPTSTLAASTAELLRGAGSDVRAADLLGHTRPVADQAGLDRTQRAANVAGAFVLHRPAGRGATSSRTRRSPPDVVVVDDVLTTGATVVAVTAALRAGGYRVVGAATVASV